MAMTTVKSLRVSAGKIALGLSTIFAIAPIGRAQTIQAQSVPPATSGGANLARATASLADHPPIIDGRDDDPIWKSAAPITGFRVFDPKEDGDPTFQTEAKI